MTIQSTDSPTDYNLLDAFRTAVRQYKPWHQPHWHSQGARDPLYALMQKAEDLGIMSPEIAEDLGLRSSEYQGVKEGAFVPERKTRKKLWSHFKSHLGMR